jgi:O-antigen/teichoic acid export membrane protein
MPALREMSWYTFSNFVAQGLSFLGILFVSRYLGPTNLGLYSFVQNYALTIFTILSGSDFYFSWAVARSEDFARDIKKFIVYRFHIALVLSLLGIVAATLILPRDVAIMCIVMLAPVFLNSFAIFHFYSLAKKKAKLVAALQIASAIIIVSMKIILVLLKAPLIYFIYVSAIDVTILSTAYFIFYLKNTDIMKEIWKMPTPKISETFKFLYDIKMNVIVIFLWQLLLRADQLILAKVTNAYTLGIYASAVKIAEVPNVLAGILYLTMVSRMVPLIKSDSSHSHLRLRRVFYLYLLIGCAMSIGVIVFAPLAVKIIYGAEFLGAIPVLQVYALSIPGLYLTYFFFSLFGAIDKHKVQSAIFFLAVVLNIVLVLFLTPIYGLIGTAFATSITYSLAGALFYMYWRRSSSRVNIESSMV